MLGGNRKQWRRRMMAAAGVAGGAALLSGVGIGYVTARVLTVPQRSGPYDEYAITPFETGADFEEVTFRPRHGEHVLHGWWLRRPGSDRVVVGCHGYRGGKFELVGIATALWRAGFNVLLFDFHGHRPGHPGPVTLGYATTEDFFGAIAYAKRRVPSARIGVIGFSMGASAAIIGSARCPDVRAVVADTPFSTHAAVVAHGVRRLLRLPARATRLPTLAVRAADVFLPRLAGYRGGDVQPVREVAALSPRPLLLIHGTEDSISPVAQGYAVYEAAREPKELWIVEGAAHCGAYFQDRPAYCARVVAFFTRHLGTHQLGDEAAGAQARASQAADSVRDEASDAV
ncbi:MAG: alpha/beta fold hydrolase [Ktedonobacterales bacterium]|nr:alpha/beta fold hydrolase [Ktedonobacterales bacterium]